MASSKKAKKDEEKPDAAKTESQAESPPESQSQSSKKSESKESKAEDAPTARDSTEARTPQEVLDRQREEEVRQHNSRTGGGDVHEGELQRQREEHLRRTGAA